MTVAKLTIAKFWRQQRAADRFPVSLPGIFANYL